MKAFKESSKVILLGALVLLFTVAPSMGASVKDKTTAATKSVSKDAASSTVKATSKTMRAKKDSILADLPRLSVTYFKKAVPAGTMMATASMSGGGSSSPPTSTSIELGDEIELAWSIQYKKVRNPRVTIDGQTVTGSAHTASDGTPWMAGKRTYRPSSTKTYNLVATAAPEGGGAMLRAQKSFRVTVKKPILSILEPEVNQNNMTIKFFAKNTGNATFRPTPINVNYQVEGGTLANGSFTTPRMEIRKNQRVELGQITLPDRERALGRDSIRIRVDIGASYVLPLASDREDFTHEWTTSTVRINSSMLRLLGMGTVAEIMIDNWSNPTSSNRAITPPYEANACFVDLSVFDNSQRMSFDLPPLEDRKTGGALPLVYWTFLRNIHSLHRGDADLFSVSDGKLKIALHFPNTDAREIKIGRIGNVGGYDGKWIDDDAPDVNLSSFTVNIKFTPALSGGQLTYTDVAVDIAGLSASFPGGWSWLNAGFSDYATRTIRRNLDSTLTSILNNATIKNSIVSGINSGISATGVSIIRIIRVSGAGDTITVEYL